MNKIIVQNLELIITDKCNLNCKHCFNGTHNMNSMSSEIIEATLSQISDIVNLNIGGGEPTLAINSIRTIIEYIINNRINIQMFSIVINATIYSEELLMLLTIINNYIKSIHSKNGETALFISYDIFHLKELERLNLLESFKENVKKYSKCEFFAGFRKINNKLFKEGNATNLDESIVVPLKPPKIVMTYYDDDSKPYIGPLVTINYDGTITEANASNDKRVTKYNYGNVLETPIVDAYQKNKNVRILKPRKFFKEMSKIIDDYVDYNK